MRQLSFYLRNSLCMELFREFKFPFPNPSLNYCFFYCVRKHLCISWTCELQFWKSTRFSVCQPRLFPTASIRGFKALSKSNYDIICRKAKITRHRGPDLPFLASSAGKQVYQNLYQIVSFLKQSSDFLISAKGNIYPSNNPWLILSSLQGFRYIHSRCFGIRPWFGWTLERRISWPKG